MRCKISYLLFSLYFVNSVLSQISDNNTNEPNNQIESTLNDDYIRYVLLLIIHFCLKNIRFFKCEGECLYFFNFVKQNKGYKN